MRRSLFLLVLLSVFTHVLVKEIKSEEKQNLAKKTDGNPDKANSEVESSKPSADKTLTKNKVAKSDEMSTSVSRAPFDDFNESDDLDDDDFDNFETMYFQPDDEHATPPSANDDDDFDGDDDDNDNEDFETSDVIQGTKNSQPLFQKEADRRAFHRFMREGKIKRTNERKNFDMRDERKFRKNRRNHENVKEANESENKSKSSWGSDKKSSEKKQSKSKSLTKTSKKSSEKGSDTKALKKKYSTFLRKLLYKIKKAKAEAKKQQKQSMITKQSHSKPLKSEKKKKEKEYEGETETEDETASNKHKSGYSQSERSNGYRDQNYASPLKYGIMKHHSKVMFNVKSLAKLCKFYERVWKFLKTVDRDEKILMKEHKEPFLQPYAMKQRKGDYDRFDGKGQDWGKSWRGKNRGKSWGKGFGGKRRKNNYAPKFKRRFGFRPKWNHHGPHFQKMKFRKLPLQMPGHFGRSDRFKKRRWNKFHSRKGRHNPKKEYFGI